MTASSSTARRVHHSVYRDERLVKTVTPSQILLGRHRTDPRSQLRHRRHDRLAHPRGGRVVRDDGTTLTMWERTAEPGSTEPRDRGRLRVGDDIASAHAHSRGAHREGAHHRRRRARCLTAPASRATPLLAARARQPDQHRRYLERVSGDRDCTTSGNLRVPALPLSRSTSTGTEMPEPRSAELLRRASVRPPRSAAGTRARRTHCRQPRMRRITRLSVAARSA